MWGSHNSGIKVNLFFYSLQSISKVVYAHLLVSILPNSTICMLLNPSVKLMYVSIGNRHTYMYQFDLDQNQKT